MFGLHPFTLRRLSSTNLALAVSRCFYVGLGLIFLTAAMLKGLQLASPSQLSKHWLITPPAVFVLIGLEAFFGLWLCFGHYPAATRWVALFVFAVLFGFSLSQALAGKASCACFGALNVTPWLTALFDLAALIALAILCPPPQFNIRAWILFSPAQGTVISSPGPGLARRPGARAWNQGGAAAGSIVRAD